MKIFIKLFFVFFIVFGQLFAQDTIGKTYQGIASFYAKKFEGRTTANGENFSNYDMTCAHRKLKFNTLLKVTNLKNGLSTIVRVNDRGPYVKGRIIDLSEQAARMIGKYQKGLGKVEIEIIQPLAVTTDLKAVFKNEPVADCLGNKVELKNFSLSLWRTKDLSHALLLANHLYVTEDLKKILIASKGLGKNRRYHLVITGIQTKTELNSSKDFWERKGFMKVLVFDLK
ncbi:MAG TPA: septal ring lytic transglycosylase RlpA family protein [Bacteroidia bacterium]|nr:septal ring lytic transglycosylase RlpA family protein [Bacteroidia bacterium]HNU32286.1 septal ring lytic transglycosylase RlpA family protein [Bacteroidia bacterium]